MGTTTMTNREVRALEEALHFIKNLKLPEGGNAIAYNYLQTRAFRIGSFFKPHFNALHEIEDQQVARYDELAKGQITIDPNTGAKHFGSHDAAYMKEWNATMNEAIEGEVTKFKPFLQADFDAVPVAIPAALLERLGDLYEMPAE